MIEKGLEAGILLYLNNPENPEKFKLNGKDLIPVIKGREKARNEMAGAYRKKAPAVL